LIGTAKKFLPNDHDLVRTLKKRKYLTSLKRLAALRNFAAHSSSRAKKQALAATNRQRMHSAGAWLKRSNRFQKIVEDLQALAEEIREWARV
jgi:MoxR-like ATPase